MRLHFKDNQRPIVNLQKKHKILILLGFFYVTSFILFQNFTPIGNHRKDFEINDNRCVARNEYNQNLHSIIDYMTENERAALYAGDLSCSLRYTLEVKIRPVHIQQHWLVTWMAL